ncbi:U5 small nuclear ribonucleoprotein, putative [Theileria equi strain WA]|uniref:U5 small nuclear ribonucleoprotein, putative n=1 Tax=Theileria equi strain WA TaxID=1537102 RepID=L0B1M0_THEEQ|nr:U5 small nuclear ribonucleoprotein, putative [Theileria equi strain WA]AFZ81019.1 U5 small nuclear ribonucleoprotein, putative [Theileria equi strain WA]|eukprot:XP_004830685.1 U5 small nuclear ribonucleoprotein, putative [Theileria equi strain WA]
MDQNLYDEFGNYIGPGLDEDFEGGLDSDLSDAASDVEVKTGPETPVTRITRDDIVTYDDSAAEDEVYKDAEVFIQEEDTQTINVPIVQAEETHIDRVSTIHRLDSDITAKNFDILEESLPKNRFTFQFMTSLMNQPEFIRNICIAGTLHHGKTTLVDRLIEYSRFMEADKFTRKAPEFTRYTDSRLDEQARALTIKSTPISLVFQNDLYEDVDVCSDQNYAENDNPKHKSYLFNIFDTPGHVNFMDEFVHALSVSDGCVVVVDVLMGLESTTENILRLCIHDNIPFILVINCIDRLVLELKLPPSDAYHKIRHTIYEANDYIASTCKLLNKQPVVLSPLSNNVAFASTMFGIFFTLKSFAKLYSSSNIDSFAKKLWGNMFYNPFNRKFVKHEVVESGEEEVTLKRSFVAFILEPIYKLISHVASDERSELQDVLSEFGISLKADDYKMSTKRILRKVCAALFSDASAFVEIIVSNIPSPLKFAHARVSTLYTGDVNTTLYEDMINCDPNGQLMVFVSKNYYRLNGSSFDLFGRVISGTIKKGDPIKILGESYTLDDDEDVLTRKVESLWISEARYRVQVSSVPAGNWVLISGIDLCSHKTCTITDVDDSIAEIFSIKRYLNITDPVFKVSCEPLNPSELPKMVEGLRKIEKSYPSSKLRVEESGEHIILGTGELYLDCILHDLRRLYGDLEIKVSDPVVRFTETIMETSAVKCFSETANGKNKLYMIAEPLETGIASSIDEGLIDPSWTQSQLSSHFSKVYNWDVLASRSIWAFGPDGNGPNILLNDTLPSDVDKVKLDGIKHSIIQGFSWACREGPLIEEPIRNVKFKLLGADIADEMSMRTPGQLIPTARRVTYASFLLATPRLMEPIVFSEIHCPADCVSSIYTLLARRRGHVLRDMPKPGTPFYTVHAYLPAIDSFGFETDLRIYTSGQAFCLTMFDHWNIVPGDPLDKSIVLKPLEPAPVPHLAREFLLKTRKRKGLTEDVSLNAFFDDPMLSDLVENLEEFH